MTSILITGAGMVGAHAARAMLDMGHEVSFLDSAPDAAYVRRITGRDVTIAKGDVRELPAVIEAMQQAHAEVVVHTAALIGGAAQVNPYRGVQVNVMGTVNIAEAARLTGVRRVVHASTLGCNDLSYPQDRPLDERFPLGSAGRIYGASKVACEQLLWAYGKAHGFELALLRFAGVYGFGYFTGGSGIGREVRDLLVAAREGRPGVVGDGMPGNYEIVHAADVGQGVALAATVATLPNHIYNIGTGVLITPEELIEAVARVHPGFTGSRGPAGRPDPHPRTQPFDLARARTELGYAPRYDLDGGLRALDAELAAGA